MWGGVIIYESCGRHVVLSIADPILYDMVKNVTASPEGMRRYGMKSYWCRGNIPDGKVDGMCRCLEGLATRLTDGEEVDVDKELALAD